MGYGEILDQLGGAGSLVWGCCADDPIADAFDAADADETATRATTADVERFGDAPPIDTAIEKLLELGFRVDGSLYSGLPPDIVRRDFEYLITAAEAVASLPDVTPQIERTAYRLTNHWMEDEDGSGSAAPQRGGRPLDQDRYPLGGADAVEAGTEAVKLVFAPAAVRLRKHFNSIEEARDVGSPLPRLDDPIKSLIAAGKEYALTLYFDNAEGIPPIEVAALPMPALGRTQGIQYAGQPYYGKYVALPELGKAVVQQKELQEVADGLALGRDGGARVLGFAVAVKLFDNVYLTEVKRPGEPRCRRLVYPITDANGGARHDRPVVDPKMGGRFENGVHSDLGYDPRIGRHSLLKVPFPRPAPAQDARRYHRFPQERIVVDDCMAALTPPIVIFRRAETWRPYMPDFVLDNRLAFDDGDVELVVAFSSIQPEHLLRLLCALRDADVTPVLEDAALTDKLHQYRPYD